MRGWRGLGIVIWGRDNRTAVGFFPLFLARCEQAYGIVGLVRDGSGLSFLELLWCCLGYWQSGRAWFG
jgi:hypothetical protein